MNIETSVRVAKRSDFFLWVQGVFQGVLGHELLVCAVAEPGNRAFRMEWMSSRPLDEALFAQLCEPGGGLMYRLIALWEKSGLRPLVVNPDRGSSDEIAAEVGRLQLDKVVAHGVPDIRGRAAGLFAFSWLSGRGSFEAVRALELIVPYLYAAWVRANCDGRGSAGITSVVTREVLTAREVEILNWVEQGKSNNEIAQILSISHLTVKNHVQKILRKLNVQNRAQAVAKGINLNLTQGRAH
jgi:transcriptional regulator EpsA